MAQIRVKDISKFSDAINDLINQYGDLAEISVGNGLEKATEVLVENLKEASPVNSGDFKKKWKVNTYKKHKIYMVSNTKMVVRKKGSKSKVPLIDILEYSVVRGNPFVHATFDKSIDEMVKVFTEEVKKELGG